MPDWPPYPSGPFTPEFVVGGFGGSGFETCGWVTGRSSLVVKGLDVWYNDSTLRGIQVTYSDNSRSSVYGNASDNHGSIVFAPGELVTSLTLWGNGSGTRCGRIRLTTTVGQTFDYGKNTSGQTPYDAPIGSGLLVGMCGRSGADVDMLGAVFLAYAVVSVAIKDVTYNPNLAGSSSGISQVALDQAYYYNPPSAKAPKDWSFQGGVTRTTSTTFTESSSTMYGVNVGVEVTAEVFGVGAKVSGGFQWQQTGTVEQSSTVSNSQLLQWGIAGTLQPGEGITCTAFTEQGQGQTNYTGTVIVKLADGTTNSYQETGVFRNIVYTKVSVSTQDNTTEMPPKPIEGHNPQN